MRAKVWMYSLMVVLLAAILPLPTWAANGNIGGFMPPSRGVQERPVGVVGKILVSPFSVSFTGTDYEAVRDAFLTLVKNNGQQESIKVLDWGGTYQVRLNGQADANSVWGGFTLHGRTAVRGNLQDWEIWLLKAEIRKGDQINQLLETIPVRMEGPKTDLNAVSSSRRLSWYLGGSNSWLPRTLRQRAAGEMAKKVYDYLLQTEQLAEVNRPRDAEGKVIAQTFRYTLLSVNNDIHPLAVHLPRLDAGSEIAVYRAGHQIGTLEVIYFNADHTKVSVSGDTWAIKKGNAFKVVQ